MRFCHPFPLTANSRDGEHALSGHTRIDRKSSVQCAQPHFVVFFSRIILVSQIALSARRLENLTEFPFAHNFSKPDLEVL
jgi:hypothetical protein